MEYLKAISSWISRLSNNIESHAYFKAAKILDQQGDFEKSVDSYISAIKLKPNFADAHFNLGIAWMECAEINAAITSFKTALELKPNFPEVHCKLGLAYQRLGDLSSAINSYKTATKLKPNFPDAHYNLSLIHI